MRSLFAISIFKMLGMGGFKYRLLTSNNIGHKLCRIGDLQPIDNAKLCSMHLHHKLMIYLEISFTSTLLRK